MCASTHTLPVTTIVVTQVLQGGSQLITNTQHQLDAIKSTQHHKQSPPRKPNTNDATSRQALTSHNRQFLRNANMSNITQRLDDWLIESETQIQKLRNDLQKFDSMLPSERPSFDVDLTRRLESFEATLTRMKNECRKIQPAQRDYFEGEISSIEANYNEIVRELERKRLANRSGPASRQTEQLLANRDKSQRVTDDLDEAIRTGNDIITTGNVTMTTLGEDRRKIEHIDENLHRIDEQALDGQARAKRMLRRIVCNACLAWIIAIMLLAILACILVLKFKKII